ncbi:MAG: family 14 glycosylhydrolase [Chloroflexota bacterium]|nr:family 14 glycosylhydrolase [Chloroflexota bacterium]
MSPDLTDAEAARIRNLGFTSVEQYVHWGTVENDGEGQFDFSHWDAQIEILKRHGLKWVPFLIAGPAYSLPDWFRNSRDHYPAVCLEHRLPSKIQSIFDRAFDRHIDRFIGAFAERYRDTGVIEAPLLGITGDFGEAIYPVTGTAWPQVWPGPYHTHPGYWCGDDLAEEQFREAMLRKYGSDIDSLNAAWGTGIAVPAGIRLPALEIADGIEAFRADEPTSAGTFPIESPQDRRRWLDFIDWYRGAMNALARFWMTTTRRHFPDHPIYLCTGGDAPPHHGAHFGEQCRVAASAGGGVRITNEASNYPHNFTLTRWVTSAGRHYGAYTGIEPAGGVNEFGVTCRIYNAAVSGAKNLHFYAPNLVHHRETIDAWHASFDAIREESPQLDVAFLYPDTSIMLGDVSTSDVAIQAALLRDLMDIEYLDDAMIADGALDPFQVLVMACCPVVEQATLDQIDAWIAGGGILVILGDRGIESVDGTAWVPQSQTGQIIRAGEFALDQDRAVTVGESIRSALADTGFILIDGIIDRIYVAHVAERLLVLNHTDAEATRAFHGPDGTTPEITLPANSITTIPQSG